MVLPNYNCKNSIVFFFSESFIHLRTKKSLIYYPNINLPVICHTYLLLSFIRTLKFTLFVNRIFFVQSGTFLRFWNTNLSLYSCTNIIDDTSMAVNNKVQLKKNIFNAIIISFKIRVVNKMIYLLTVHR